MRLNARKHFRWLIRNEKVGCSNHLSGTIFQARYRFGSGPFLLGLAH
jgi:hypothetical protein